MDNLFDDLPSQPTKSVTALDTLAHRVQRVALDLIDSKRKRRQLEVEIQTLRSDKSKVQVLARENERLRKDHMQVQERLEKLNKKLEKLMLNTMSYVPTILEPQDATSTEPLQKDNRHLLHDMIGEGENG